MWTERSSWALAVALLAAGCAGPTGGQRARIVVVLPPQPARVALVQEVVLRLQRSDGLEVIHPGALHPLMRQADAANPRLARVEPLIAEGRAALLGMRHAEAEQALAGALALLQDAFVRHYAPRRLARVHLLLGVAAHQRGAEEQARRSFAAARALWPDLTPGPRFSPQVRRSFAAARARPAATPALDGPALRRLLALDRSRQPAGGEPVAAVVLDAPPVGGLRLVQGAVFLDARAAFVGAAGRVVQPDKAKQVRRLGRRLGDELAGLLRAQLLGDAPPSSPAAARTPGRWGPLRELSELVGAAVSVPRKEQRR